MTDYPAKRRRRKSLTHRRILAAIRDGAVTTEEIAAAVWPKLAKARAVERMKKTLARMQDHNGLVREVGGRWESVDGTA